MEKRKPTRLKEYDYSTPGAYFVTICTKDKKHILSNIAVGEGLCALPKNTLTQTGEIVEESLKYINENIDGITIDKYVIMPNHIHIIIVIENTGGHGGPPLQNIINRFKSYTTNRVGRIIWQRSFHDHIIRNREDYLSIWQYIEENPAKWQSDDYYI